MTWEDTNEAAISDARKGAPRQWYVIRIESAKVAKAIELLPYFDCIAFVPTETKIVTIGHGGRKRAVERRQPLMTGYVVAGFAKPPRWLSLFDLPWFYGVICRGGWPAAISPDDMGDIFKIHHAKAASLPGAKSLQAGDTIRVREGGFAGHEAKLLEITGNEGRFILELFGKQHAVKMALSEIEAA